MAKRKLIVFNKWGGFLLQYKIGVMNGDDIGHEVVPLAVEIMKASTTKYNNVAIDWVELPIGYKSYLDCGETLPQHTLDSLKYMDGWVLGPIGHAVYPKNDPKAINPHPIIRKVFDLHSNVRPSRSYVNVNSVQNDVDLIVVRENIEGFQPDRNVYAGTGEFMPTSDLAMSVRVITRRNSEAVAETAFKLAQQRRKKVTAIHKKSVFKMGCGLFVESCRNVAQKYPDVLYEEMHVDTSAASLVMNPQKFDVLVTTNMFGDILSDLTSGLVGGLGMAPGLCIGPKYSMAQATHGSAPGIVGKEIANPYALIMSGKMLLEWLGVQNKDSSLLNASQLIEDAVNHAIKKGMVTPDMGGEATTKEMGKAICSYVSNVHV